MKKNQSIIVTLSGRGDKDVETIADYIGAKIMSCNNASVQKAKAQGNGALIGLHYRLETENPK